MALDGTSVVERVGGAHGVATPAVDGPRETTDGFSALSFDRSDDIVLLDNPPYGEAFTVALAFKAHSTTSTWYQYFYSHGRLSWSNSLNLYLTGAGTLRTGLRGADDSWDSSLLQVQGSFKDDTWHHYALVVESSEAKVYIDGELEASAALGAGGVLPNSHLVLGARQNLSPDVHFGGDLADVRIYGRALSPGDITALSSPF